MHTEAKAAYPRQKVIFFISHPRHHTEPVMLQTRLAFCVLIVVLILFP